VTVVLGAFSYLFAQITRPDPTYQATAAVRVERATSMASLLTELFTVASGDNLATQAAVIRGFPVLERAAKRLGRIPADVPSDQVRNTPRYQAIIKTLQAQVQAEQEANTNILKITVTTRDRSEAAKVANAVAESYREQNITTRNRQVREARRFIEAQLEEVGGRLRASEERLRDLKEQRGIVSLGDETSAALTRLTALEADLDRTRRARDEAAATIRQLQEGRPAGAARIVVDPGDPALAKLSAALGDLQVQRENLLLTLTPQHPQVRDLDAQMENVRRSVVQELEARLRALTARAGDLEVRVRQTRTDLKTIPEVALEVARVQRDVKVNEDLFAQLKAKYQEVQIREKEQVEEVSIELPATEPAGPSNPTDWTTKLLAGLAVGLLLGLVLAFTVESLDTSIGTIEDVENLLAVPVMGLIPDIGLADLAIPGAPEGRQEAQPFLITLQNPSSAIAESYRSLRTNLDFVALERHVKTICITSASRTEGKSTTAVNLAIALAQMGRKTLLVEADLRKPFLHFAFGIPKEPGLAEAILGNQPWTAVVRTVTDLMLGRLGLDQIVGAPNIDKLHLITSGTPPSNPAEFLNSQRMTELIAAFREQFDMVIFDCAPVLPVTDAAILSSKTDGTVLVHRVGTIARAALRRSKTLLENVHGRVLGIVLTGLKAEISPDFEELEYYRYGYGEKGTAPGQPGATGGRGARAGRIRSFLSPFSSKLLLAVTGAGLAAGVAAWYGTAQLGARAGMPEVQDAPAAAVAALQPLLPVPTPSAEALNAPEAPARPQPAAVAAPTEATNDPAAATSGEGKPAHPAEQPAGSFGLQVAAFREPAKAQSDVEALRRLGLPAFSVPADIPGKGRWVRVFAGPFPTPPAAEAARARLPEGRRPAAKMHHLPYALESASLHPYERAAAVAAAARGLGYTPTILSETGPAGRPQFRVLLEAFATPQDVDAAARRLHATTAGFRAVTR
jgi:capsular exopolysaccharide synthesis family protein